MGADGVILKMSSDYTTTTTSTALAWGNVTTIGTKTWWSGANAGRLVIPTGVTRVKLYAGSRYTAANISDDMLNELQKNGTTRRSVLTPHGSGYGGGGVALGLRSVTPGDYFRSLWRYYTGTAPTLDADWTYLAAFTPESVVGLVAATLGSNTGINGEAVLSWNAPEYDNLSSHNGTTGFVVPDGVSYAIVSLSASTTAALATTTDTTHALYKNGVEVARRTGRDSWWAAGGVFMPIAVSPGDVLTIGSNAAESGATLDASLTRIGIEWIGLGDGDQPQNVYAVNLFSVVETPPETQKVYAVNLFSVVETPPETQKVYAVNLFAVLEAP